MPDGPFAAPKTTGRKKGEKKSSKKASKSTLQEHVKRNDVIAELSNDPSGLTFGQLVRENAELDKREINRVFTRRTARKQAFVGDADIRPRRLRLVNI